jgi:ankyrin repeat protein
MDIIRTFNPDVQRQILLNLTIEEQDEICSWMKLPVSCNSTDPIWKQRLFNDYGVEDWRDIYESVGIAANYLGAKFFLERKKYDKYLEHISWDSNVANKMLNDEIFLKKYINSTDRSKITLLQYIVSDDDALEKVKKLLEIGASPNIGESRSWPVLWASLFDGQEELFELFLEYGADPNVKLNGFPILSKALYLRNMKATELLLKYGADPNVGTREQGFTSLHWAVFRCPEAVPLLLKAGANPNIPSFDGTRPLHLAANFGYGNIVSDLLKAGADVDATDDLGNTALHLAALGEHKDTIEILLEAGADPTIKDGEGKTYLEVGEES